MVQVAVRFYVTGTVIGVGYEMLVKLEAQRLGVLGFVREYEDGIEILASLEGEKLEEFRKSISKRAKPDDFAVINVEKIEQYLEGEEKFINKPAKFEKFKILYPYEITEFERAKIEYEMMRLVVESENYRNLRRLREEIREIKDELQGIHSCGRKSNTEETQANKTLSEMSAELRRIRESMRELKEDFHKERYDVSYGNVQKGNRERIKEKKREKKEGSDPSYL
ncbi:MAG: acylphosphatase [Thermoplasmata archaeon]